MGVAEVKLPLLNLLMRRRKAASKYVNLFLLQSFFFFLFFSIYLIHLLHSPLQWCYLQPGSKEPPVASRLPAGCCNFVRYSQFHPAVCVRPHPTILISTPHYTTMLAPTFLMWIARAMIPSPLRRLFSRTAMRQMHRAMATPLQTCPKQYGDIY